MGSEGKYIRVCGTEKRRRGRERSERKRRREKKRRSRVRKVRNKRESKRRSSACLRVLWTSEPI